MKRNKRVPTSNEFLLFMADFLFLSLSFSKVVTTESEVEAEGGVRRSRCGVFSNDHGPIGC